MVFAFVFVFGDLGSGSQFSEHATHFGIQSVLIGRSHYHLLDLFFAKFKPRIYIDCFFPFVNPCSFCLGLFHHT